MVSLCLKQPSKIWLEPCHSCTSPDGLASGTRSRLLSTVPTVSHDLTISCLFSRSLGAQLWWEVWFPSSVILFLFFSLWRILSQSLTSISNAISFLCFPRTLLQTLPCRLDLIISAITACSDTCKIVLYFFLLTTMRLLRTGAISYLSLGSECSELWSERLNNLDYLIIVGW